MNLVAGGGAGHDSILASLPTASNSKDKEVEMLKQCFNLSVFATGFGLQVDYAVLKDITKKLELDTLLVLPAMKTAIAEISARK